MSLTNAIAVLRRQDAQVKVEVPATANRKAYSYMREGSPANPKSSVNKKAIAAGIGGAIGVGALTAGVLAMRKAKQNETSQSGDTVTGSSVTGSSVKGAIAQGQDPQRKKPLVTPPPVSSDRVLVTPAPKSIKERVEQMTNEGVAATPSKQNAVLTEPKKGSKDRKSGKTSTNKEINLNEAIYNVGKKTRKAVENLVTFAKDTVENIKKRPKTVDVKATEVTEALPEGKTMKKETKPKEPKPKKAKAPKVPKQPKPTKAEWNAVQKQLNDLNK